MIAEVRERPTALPTLHHVYLLVVVVVIEILHRLRSPALVDWMARALAALAYRVSRTKRRAAGRSLRRVFGELPEPEEDRIVRGSFEVFWDDTLGLVPWRGVATPPEIVGLSRLQAALAAGKGVVLWESGLFGRRHVAKQALHHLGYGVHQVHHETHRAGFGGDPHTGWLRDRVVFRYFAARERAFTADVIMLPASDSLAFTRTLLAALQRNGIVCITADMPFGQRLVTVPLLGVPKRFATGMVSLCRSSGAALLPLFCVRDDRGRLQVVIEPAIALPATGDREADVEAPIRQYATVLESYIRRHPEQFRSWHYPWWGTPA